jgi:hypothetical protein
LIGSGCDDGFELDRGQSSQGELTASAVVGALDPGDDREAEIVSGRPTLPAEHVVLQEREERLQRALSPAEPTWPIEPTIP